MVTTIALPGESSIPGPASRVGRPRQYNFGDVLCFPRIVERPTYPSNKAGCYWDRAAIFRQAPVKFVPMIGKSSNPFHLPLMIISLPLTTSLTPHRFPCLLSLPLTLILSLLSHHFSLSSLLTRETELYAWNPDFRTSSATMAALDAARTAAFQRICPRPDPVEQDPHWRSRFLGGPSNVRPLITGPKQVRWADEGPHQVLDEEQARRGLLW